MLTLQTQIRVDHITGTQIFDFFVDPDDRAYQRWWPGTHLQFHALERHEDHVGDVIYMDEYVGKRRVRMSVIVLDAVPGKTLVWQFKKGNQAPVRVTFDFADYDGGVAITHTIQAGLERRRAHPGSRAQALLLTGIRYGDGRPRRGRVPAAARSSRPDQGLTPRSTARANCRSWVCPTLPLRAICEHVGGRHSRSPSGRGAAVSATLRELLLSHDGAGAPPWALPLSSRQVVRAAGQRWPASSALASYERPR